MKLCHNSVLQVTQIMSTWRNLWGLWETRRWRRGSSHVNSGEMGLLASPGSAISAWLPLVPVIWGTSGNQLLVLQCLAVYQGFQNPIWVVGIPVPQLPSPWPCIYKVSSQLHRILLPPLLGLQRTGVMVSPEWPALSGCQKPLFFRVLNWSSARLNSSATWWEGPFSDGDGYDFEALAPKFEILLSE